MTRTVIITRPKGPHTVDDGFTQRLASEGFNPLSFSAFAVEVRALVRAELDRIDSFLKSPDAWLAFLSPTAVLILREIATHEGWNLAGSAARIATQGSGTSESVRRVFGREADLESTSGTAEVFARQIGDRLGGRGRVLVPQSAEGRDVFGPLVRAEGNEVVCIATYGLSRVSPTQSEIEGVMECDPSQSCIVFMSPSAVRATAESFPDLERLRSLRVISIGPTTSKAVRECGLRVFAEATEHSEDGVLRCIKDLLKT